jgi:roadblock/LC7 domain-containing protein
MMHNLSDVSQTKGCIGVGENTQQGRLVNSRAWSDLLNSKITAAENNGEDVWIEIND